jgi:hypothetical protein
VTKDNLAWGSREQVAAVGAGERSFADRLEGVSDGAPDPVSAQGIHDAGAVTCHVICPVFKTNFKTALSSATF